MQLLNACICSWYCVALSIHMHLGYFVPKSFDKKGLYEFLFDRVKRLGIPFVVYTYLLGPYVYAGTCVNNDQVPSSSPSSHIHSIYGAGFMHLFFQTDFPQGTSDWGPTWFLNQLMFFSLIYALACGKEWSPKINCPSLAGFFGIGVFMGLLVGIIILFLPPDEYFAVPGFW